MTAIRGVEINVTCRHMSAHAGTYQHMSACPNVLTHVSIQDKFQMADIRVAESGLTCWHMSACPNVLTDASSKISFKWLKSEVC